VAEEVPVKVKTRWRDSLRVYFLAGLLVFLPVAITLWFIGWVIALLDSVLDVLPDALHPNAYLPFAIPKLGAVVTLFLILFLGILTRGVATRRFLAAWENIFVKIPVFRGIYSAVQKLVQSFLGQSNSQRQVVMIEYPRTGVFTIGFAMGRIRLIDVALTPYVNAIYATPRIALIPILVLWLGIDFNLRITIVALGAVFPIIVNTYAGAKHVDPDLLEQAVVELLRNAALHTAGGGPGWISLTVTTMQPTTAGACALCSL